MIANPSMNGHNRLLDQYGKPIQDDRGFVLPPYRTFSAIFSSLSKSYVSTYDEALKHSHRNALAMPRDAFLMGCLQERMLQLAELKWHLEPENEKDARQKQITRDLQDIIKATDRWIQFTMQLAWATWYGRYGNQLAWKPKTINGKRRLAVVNHSPVNGDKIQFGWDGVPRVYVNYQWITDNAPPGHPDHKWIEDYSERDALMQQDNPSKPVIIGDRAPMLVLKDPRWRERFIIHKHMCIDADYFDGEMAGGLHGVGLRSQVYWFFHLRDEMIGWAINHLQKIGVGGILMFYYDEGNDTAKEAAENAAKDAGERYALAMPRPRGSSKDVTQAELLPFNESGVTAMTGVVQDYFERHIERLMIGQTLSSKPAGGGLGDGTATLHSDTKHRILMFDAMNLGDTLSSDYVPVAKKWNFPKADFNVRFVFDVPDPDAESKISAANAIFQMGGTVKAVNVRGPAGFEKPEKDDEVFSQAQVAKDQASAQAEMQAAQAQAEQQKMVQQQQVAEQKAALQQKQADQKHQSGLSQQEDKHAQKLGHREAEHGQKEELKSQDEPLNLPPLSQAEASLLSPQGVQELSQMQDDDEVMTYAAQHAPKGGITIGGKKFVGGEFIPSKTMARATPQERRRLAQKQQASKAPQQPQQPGENQIPLPQKEVGSESGQTVEQQPGQEGQQQEAAPMLPKQIVPNEQMEDLLKHSYPFLANNEHAEPVLQAIVDLSKLTPDQYPKAAGRAYQRSAANAQAGMAPNQDTYDALAFRLIEKFRWRREKLTSGKARPTPINKNVDAAALKIGRGTGTIASPVIRHNLKKFTQPLAGPVDAYGRAIPFDPVTRTYPGTVGVSRQKLTSDQRLTHDVHKAAIEVGTKGAVELVGLGVAHLPAFIRWLRGANTAQPSQAPQGSTP